MAWCTDSVSRQCGRHLYRFAALVVPTGSYLFAANQGSNKVVVFRIDSNTGHITPAGEALEAPSPVCIKFMAID
jgi:6-phosphogluconolactonase (cycloisomerase 2 family)